MTISSSRNRSYGPSDTHHLHSTIAPKSRAELEAGTCLAFAPFGPFYGLIAAPRIAIGLRRTGPNRASGRGRAQARPDGACACRIRSAKAAQSGAGSYQGDLLHG